jgi:hypothetical protein
MKANRNSAGIVTKLESDLNDELWLSPENEAAPVMDEQDRNFEDDLNAV